MSAKQDRKPHFTRGGIHHATINGHRFHLRLAERPDQQNLLWIDGRQPAYILDKTAAKFVTLAIEGMWRHQQGDGDQSQAVRKHVVNEMYHRYGRLFALGKRRITKKRISADFDQLFGTLKQLSHGDCPVDIGLAQKEINVASWTAPARMDLAVTYRCNLRCQKCYLQENVLPDELTIDQWKHIYATLWQIGVPQVVFTGGEPLVRGDLLDLIREADEFVTGLVTNGTLLKYHAEDLCDASLDYVQVTIESDNASIHNTMVGHSDSWDPFKETVTGIEAALAAGLEVVTNTTLTAQNGEGFPGMIEWLYDLGVKHVACNRLICSGRGIKCRETNDLTDKKLAEILEKACEIADELKMDIQWYSPTCYTLGINPLKLGFGAKSCSAAAHNMTIQPDGTVLPCQSWPESVGNILTNSWTSIWEHPTCLKLRQHAFAQLACHDCEFMQDCGGGCPLDTSKRQDPFERS